MALTSSYRRRTAGFTALFAALLLMLTALFAITPAAALEKHCPDHEGHPNKTQGATAEGSGNLVLDAGTSFCVKKKNGASGTLTADGNTTLYGYLLQIGIAGEKDEGPSYYIIYGGHDQETAVTPERPDFTNPDCDTNAGVILPETEGVDYGYDSADVVPGGTVTVTATPKDGYRFPADAEATWGHTFSTIPEDCEEEPTAIAPEAPTFTDPTCDVNTVGLDVPPDSDLIDYTVTGDQEPGGTVTVTAELAPGFVLEEGATDTWEHTYDPLATDCEGVGGSEADPAASVTVDCEADNQIVLDNTGSDVAVTYTITGVDGYGTVEVPAGEEQVITDLGIEEDDSYDIVVSAEGMDDATAAGTYDCVTPTPTETPTETPTTDVAPDEVEQPTPDPTETPTTDVAPDEVERPAPDPSPVQANAQVAAQDELPATGLGSTELLVLALLMLGLGTAAVRGSNPRRQD